MDDRTVKRDGTGGHVTFADESGAEPEETTRSLGRTTA